MSTDNEPTAAALPEADSLLRDFVDGDLFARIPSVIELRIAIGRLIQELDRLRPLALGQLDYEGFVRQRIASGDDPNAITRTITEAIRARASDDWSQWGDGRWYRRTVCSICGSSVAGICGHQFDPGRRLIPRKREAAQ